LDHLQLVHMNGRIYDPVIGKMIPDPNIQSPDNLQSFNRYAYVWNNPLSHTDPSGFYTTSVSGSAPGGAYQTYVEPIAAAYMAKLDNTPGVSQSQDIKVEVSTSNTSEAYTDEEGNSWTLDYTTITVTISTAGAVSQTTQITLDTGGSAQPLRDLTGYGMGESSGTGATSPPTGEGNGTGVSGTGADLGGGMQSGSAVSGVNQNAPPVAAASVDGTQNGNKNYANGAGTLSFQQGKVSVL
jgi:RHS repeat-associated protein